MKPTPITQDMTETSTSSSSSRYYKLYMRKKFAPVFHIDDPQGRILFIFTLSRNAPRAMIQRWTYSGLAYASWEDDAPNPLARETTDDALYGLVEAKHVEDRWSELRRIVSLSPEDLDRHDREWQEFVDGEVEAERKRGNRGEEEALRTEVMMRHNFGWQGQFFKNLAYDKLELLLRKELLRT
ncbi:hypothetical protein ISF_04991 [Cordyceps fumosorosea ARSEF 2679]|uniref:Uncharacterized protein n=1 Tax=Cordyceps fumosorosea (strain ARSEF 2679) TaxID=1081104 RepID=A0A167VY96_CORFA|nr:hypothetical protein ISF_04991 [Cordyceps fumosorosea ARSEF 2679]OAA63115.1 hypothetical protein ISF_04991 [Cordyceps fumosorosea ARSEF 2679]